MSNIYEDVTHIDYTTFIGIAACLLFIFIGITLGGNILSFIDLPAVMIVILGTFAVTTACYSYEEILGAQPVMLKTMFYHKQDIQEAARKSIKIAEIARKNGILNLEKFTDLFDHNEFLLEAVNMLIDNYSVENIDKFLHQKIAAIEERHAKTIAILRKSAEIGPAMGLVGTLIGLVQMLGNINDVKKIGPAMAVALLTTFYGTLLSYIFFFPIAAKLERNSKEEMMVYKIYAKSVISIAKKETPRHLETMLNSVLPPSKQIYNFKY
jgi:chemotaxis protein MotA